jgi:hypothetical protein
MTESALGLVKAESFQVPALIADIGPEATKRYFEFFTVPIRNKNTRIAYYHAIRLVPGLVPTRRASAASRIIEPITVAAYVEQHPGSPGSKTPDCRMHSLLILLGPQGSRIFWRTEERWKWHSGSLAMPTAGQQSSMTDVVRES